MKLDKFSEYIDVAMLVLCLIKMFEMIITREFEIEWVILSYVVGNSLRVRGAL